MRFGHYLEGTAVPEWRPKYVHYKGLKKQIKKVVNEVSSVSVGVDIEKKSILSKSITGDEDDIARMAEGSREVAAFEQMVLDQVAKVDGFLEEKVAEAEERMTTLRTQLEQFENPDNYDFADTKSHASQFATYVRDRVNYWVSGIKAKRLRGRDEQKLRLALSEFYRNLDLLKDYQILNFTAFQKIFKKYEKKTTLKVNTELRKKVETSDLSRDKTAEKLMKEVEAVFQKHLEGGNRAAAMKSLRLPKHVRTYRWPVFRLGLCLGICIPLAVVALIVASNRTEQYGDTWNSVFIMYRGLLLPVLFLFGFGVDVLVWKRFFINHVFIMQLSVRDNRSFHQIFEIASGLAVLWLLSVMAYIFSDDLSWFIPDIWNPLALFVAMLLWSFNPLHMMARSARWWSLKELGRVVRAPFKDVLFPDFWIADQLNSLVWMFMDIEYLICFYAVDRHNYADGSQPVCTSVKSGLRPLILILPAWFRFAQCLRRYRDTSAAFPHLVNAGKYSTSFFVVLLDSLHAHVHENTGDSWTGFRTAWVVAAVIGTCYTFSWDVKMDWGLLEKQEDGTRLWLRKNKSYADWSYCCAVVADFVLRWAWVMTMSPEVTNLIHSDVTKFLFIVGEIVRRIMWNVFRVENEHLNNCGAFRAVREVPLPFDLAWQSDHEFHSDPESSERTAKLSKRVASAISVGRALSAGGARRRAPRKQFSIDNVDGHGATMAEDEGEEEEEEEDVGAASPPARARAAAAAKKATSV